MDAGLAVTAVILRQSLIASRSTDQAFRPRLGVQIGTHIGDLSFANGCHILAQIIGQVQCKGSLIDAGEGAVFGNGDFIIANRYAVCGAGYLCRFGMQIIRICLLYTSIEKIENERSFPHPAEWILTAHLRSLW